MKSTAFCVSAAHDSLRKHHFKPAYCFCRFLLSTATARRIILFQYSDTSCNRMRSQHVVVPVLFRYSNTSWFTIIWWCSGGRFISFGILFSEIDRSTDEEYSWVYNAGDCISFDIASEYQLRCVVDIENPWLYNSTPWRPNNFSIPSIKSVFEVCFGGCLYLSALYSDHNTQQSTGLTY